MYSQFLVNFSELNKFYNIYELVLKKQVNVLLLFVINEFYFLIENWVLRSETFKKIYDYFSFLHTNQKLSVKVKQN